MVNVNPLQLKLLIVPVSPSKVIVLPDKLQVLVSLLVGEQTTPASAITALPFALSVYVSSFSHTGINEEGVYTV